MYRYMRTCARIKNVKKGYENYALKIWESRINFNRKLENKISFASFPFNSRKSRAGSAWTNSVKKANMVPRLDFKALPTFPA